MKNTLLFVLCIVVLGGAFLAGQHTQDWHALCNAAATFPWPK